MSDSFVDPRRRYRRILDVLLSALGLIAASPLIALAALCLFIEHRGSVIFAQERLGLHGRRFRMYKLRKFPPNFGNTGPGVTVLGDARMTRVGFILERLKLDELPQLVNVLKGDMSLVGPRPESLRFAHLFDGPNAALLQMVPGIFGPSQATLYEPEMYPPDEDPEAFYCRVIFPKKAAIDLEYFARATLVQDLVWIVRGVLVSVLRSVNWKRLLGFHAIIVSVDVIAVVSALIAAFLLMPAQLNGWQLVDAMLGLLIVPPIVVGGLLVGGCYRHPARHFSHDGAVRLVATMSVALPVALGILGLMAPRQFPWVLWPLSWLTLGPALILPRAFRRLAWQHRGPRTGPVRRVLIYGAGVLGTALARWMADPESRFHPVGFLDDDPELRGCRLDGIDVLGREGDLQTVRTVCSFDEVWLTFTPTREKQERIRLVCERLEIPLVVLAESEPFRERATVGA